MIKVLSFVLALLPSPVWATIAVVQDVGAQSTGPVANITTGDITTTSGNLIICDIGFYSFYSFGSVTDSKSNTYSAAISPFFSSGDSAAGGAQYYVANATGGGAHNFTVTWGGGGDGYTAVSCKEVSDAKTSGVLDKTATKSDNSCTTGCTSSSTTAISQANELIAGGGALGPTTGTSTFTVGATYTEDQNFTYDAGAGQVGLITGHKVVSSGGTYAFTFDLDAAETGVLGWVSTWLEDLGAPAQTTRRRPMILQ